MMIPMVCGGGLPGSYRILFIVLDINNDCPIAIERDIKAMKSIDNISTNDVLLISRSLSLCVSCGKSSSQRGDSCPLGFIRNGVHSSDGRITKMTNHFAA